MRKQSILFIGLTLLLLLPKIYYAQHELFIPAPTDPNVYLDSIITADNPNNVPKDPLRVYTLERGKKYRAHASIVNTGWVLRIKAKDGSGARPIISITKTVTGTALGQFVNVSGDVWLRSICVTMRQESDPTTVEINNGSVLATATAGNTITVDSCIMSNVSGQIIRTVSAPLKIFVTNSIFANMGNLLVSNFGSGKGIDLRDGTCDTLLLRNNIFVNTLDRVVRHYTSTAALNTFIFDHNTVVNGCSYHGMLSLGWIGKKVQITDNLFQDAFALGADTDKTRQVEFNESGEKDIYGGNRMSFIITDEATPAHVSPAGAYTIKNNYYSISSVGAAWFSKYANGGSMFYKFPYTSPDLYGAPLTHKIAKALGADSVKAFTIDQIALNKTPALMTKLMDNYRDPAGANKKKPTNPTGFNIYTTNFDNRTIPYFRDTMDTKYSTSLTEYKAGNNAQPVGSLLHWGISVKTAVEKTDNVLPNDFQLQQNYPNPFNPATTISYGLPKEAKVKLEVFDVLGRLVSTLVNSNQSAGHYTVNFDASKLSSGMYIYRLSTSGQSISKKMLLMK